MLLLIAGLILFLIPHLLKEMGVRQYVIDCFPSTGAYKGVFSLTVLAGLVLIVWGKSSSPFIMLWQPIFELHFISHILMIPASILLVAGNLPMSYTRKYLRNPMLLSVTFWGFSHLWSNGDMASALLFGGFSLWAGSKFIFSGLKPSSSDESASLLWDLIALLAGSALYVLISFYHGQLFGVGLNFV